jgi:DNA-binding response OmpR family regulator
MARILAVDDDPGILGLLQFRLKREGHEVLAYPSAGAALEAMAQLPPARIPDVAILDVMMPDKSGLDLCKELRGRQGWDDLPVIFLSARMQPADIAEGRALRAAYLTKPFVASALLKAIDQAVKSRKTP